MSSNKKIYIELNKEYVREVLLKGQPTQAICRELAEEIADRYGNNAIVDVHVGKNRCNASVSAPEYDNNLLRAMR